jgi:hypothetical protein
MALAGGAGEAAARFAKILPPGHSMFPRGWGQTAIVARLQKFSKWSVCEGEGHTTSLKAALGFQGEIER